MSALSIAPLPVIYRINGEGKIVYVNAQWDVFARENGGEAAGSAQVLGRSLASCLADPTVRMLYRRMITVAQGGRAITFQYRCDAPEARRLFEMTIQGAGVGDVDFISTLKEHSQRDPVALFDAAAPRTGVHLRVCSWCQRVAVSPTEWIEAEEVAGVLGVFIGAAVPQMTHGICDSCQEAMLKLLLAE